jgi:hypothetical protein
MSISINYRKRLVPLVLCVLIFLILVLIGRVIAYRKALASTTFSKNYELLTSLKVAEKRIEDLSRKRF